MKKTFAFFALVAGALSFTSCNKNLKDDIKEIRNELGMDAPITISTSFKDYNNIDRTISNVFKFKGAALYSNALIKNADGTYDIRINRIDALGYDQYANLEFHYDPTTKKITNKYLYHEWDETINSNGDVDVYEGNSPVTGLTFNIEIKNLDLEKGYIEVSAKVDGTKEYSQNYSWRVPNDNEPFSTSFEFKGDLKKFERLNENPS